jgi:hypothetical protein
METTQTLSQMTTAQLRSELAKADAEMRSAIESGDDRKAQNFDGYAMDICSLLNA